MRTILRSPALIHLLVLAIPLAAIGFTFLAGSDPRTQSQFFVAGSWVCVAASVVFFITYFVQAARNQPLDEQAQERRQTNVLFAFELMVDALALGQAIASPVVALVFVAIAAAWIVAWSVPTFRRTRINSSFMIRRRPEVVFAFISDRRNLPLWRSETETVEMLTPEPIGPGTRFRVRARLPVGYEVDGIEEIVDFEPYHRVTSRVASAMQPNFDEIIFEPVEDATHVIHTFDVVQTFSNAALGARFRQPGNTRLIMALRQAGENRIKQILEGPPAGQPIA